MKVRNWQYLIRDISEYPPTVKDKKLFVLANSVNAANYDLIRLLRDNDKVLEVGCGADSYLHRNIDKAVHWEGIDVYNVDQRGRPCIASCLGSVHAIPFTNGCFDYVLSNQSIEHWFEYGVRMEDGLWEMARVLKDGGELHINFPLFLHGHPWFVTGDIQKILTLFDSSVWKIKEIVAYEDHEVEDYKGWQKSKFPYFYVSKYGAVNTSFAVSVVASKISGATGSFEHVVSDKSLALKKRNSLLQRSLTHGIKVTLWKMQRKLFSYFYVDI